MGTIRAAAGQGMDEAYRASPSWNGGAQVGHASETDTPGLVTDALTEPAFRNSSASLHQYVRSVSRSEHRSCGSAPH